MSQEEQGSSLAEIVESIEDRQEATEGRNEQEITEENGNDSNDNNSDDSTGTDDSELRDAEEDEPEDKPKKSGFEKRVSKLNHKIEMQRQEAEYWKEQALRGQQAQKAQPQPVDEFQLPPKPTFAMYNDIDAYTEAVTDWKILKLEVENIQKEEQRKQTQNLDNYNKRVAEYVKSNPDFAEAVAENGDVYCAPEIHEVALESDVGPAIVYYLSKNTDEIDRINKMTPKKRLVELGKLEERLSKAQDKAPAKTTVKTQRAAPEPIKSVKGAAVTSKSIYEMSPQELMAYRNKTVGYNR